MIDNRTQRRRVKDFWYSWHPADYAVKTAHLTAVQDGIYRRLLDHYYLQHGKVLANATILLRVCRAFDAAEVAAVHDMLAEFFTIRDGYYHHDRADHELEKRALLREKRALAGSKGGKQKVANATNLLGVCQTQLQLQSQKKEENYLESDSSSKRVGEVASDPPPPQVSELGFSGGEPPPPERAAFGKRPARRKTNGVEAGLGDDLAGSVANYWNAMAEDLKLPQVRMMTKTRRAKVEARVAEFGGLRNFTMQLLDQIPHQPFLHGRNSREWRVDFDWILEPSNAVKISEGKYTNGHA